MSSFGTLTKCASKTSPAFCGSTAGSFIIPVDAVSTTVRTSAVTAESQKFLTQDSSLDAKLGVTCNTKDGLTLRISGRTEGSSFTVSVSHAPSGNPVCLSYHLLNCSQ